MTAPRSLEDWLAHQQALHPQAIALGLSRVRRVYRAMGTPRPGAHVIVVGGTNGKGSTVALLEAMLRAAGRRTLAYTSPHLSRYTERVRLSGEELPDARWVAAFEAIEAARGDVPLTMFEYGTLAALWLGAREAVDVALLEVGLGGRLDAVNVVDADISVLTSVDLDHREFLGPDRDAIGYEKAGIFRAGRPAIVGRAMPSSVAAQAQAIGVPLSSLGREFKLDRATRRWRHRDGVELALQASPLRAPVQWNNVALALATLHALRDVIAWNAAAYVRGAAQVAVPGRLEHFGDAPACFVDVAHNPAAARALADWLRTEPGLGRTLAVFGVLSDKDVAGIAAELLGVIDAWHVCDVEPGTPRGTLGSETARSLRAVLGDVPVHVDGEIAHALAHARRSASREDRIVVFGSFHVAGPARALLKSR